VSDLRFLLDQVCFARRYTLGLLESIPPALWFTMPPGGVTHVAWQAGHLAFGEFRLLLERVRGARPDDATVLPPAYFTLFGRDSIPDADPSRYPTPGEIREVMDRVHERALADLAGLPEAELDEPPLTPHGLAATKRQVLVWCSHHEMVHAGQIALLRRLLGFAPQW
jgi:hypothetical protein